MKKPSILGVLLLSILLVGCTPSQKKTDKLQVVSTTGMIHDIVKNIGSSQVDARVLMGPGVDPHLYKATEGDVRILHQADIIFFNGLHLESKLGEIFEKISNPQRKVIAVADSIPTRNLRSPKEFKGFHDPHVWFDVSLWKLASIEVEQTLVDADPNNTATYNRRGAAYRDTLDQLNEEIRRKIESIPINRRILVTAHDAFGYFGDAYGFEVVGLQGISTQSEAGARDVEKLASFIAQRKIPAIFIESSIPVRAIQAVQNATKAKGWDVKIGGELFSDAMGTEGAPEGTYVGMIRHNINTIVSELK